MLRAPFESARHQAFTVRGNFPLRQSPFRDQRDSNRVRLRAEFGVACNGLKMKFPFDDGLGEPRCYRGSQWLARHLVTRLFNHAIGEDGVAGDHESIFIARP